MRMAVVFGVIMSCFLIRIATAAVINPATQQQTQKITQAFQDPITVIKSVALKSSRHLNSYYVGISFVAHEIEMVGIGIWLVEGGATEPKVVYSVNATARVFSKYPNAHQIKIPARIADHETQLILNYLKTE